MRRKDREMPEAFGWAVADKCEWAVLGLIDADGEVYPVPVTIVREGSRVYFHSAPVSYTHLSPLFSRSFAFMREKRKMYSVQKFLCPSGTIASALKIVPKPIDNLRRVLYNATMLLR